MNGARAILNNAPFSPQKARLIADMVRGKSVARAWEALQFSTKRPARAIEKLLASAVANARVMARNEQWHEGGDLDEDALVIMRITVDDGVRMKRIRPRARGMAYRIIRRRCSIRVEIDAPVAPQTDSGT